MMRGTTILGVSLSLFLCSCNSAQAQNSWLDTTKNILGSELGQSILTPRSSSQGSNAALSALSIGDMNAGLKEALNVATKAVVAQLGAQDGFNLDPKIHIPLPSSLQRVDSALSAVGMNGLTSDLELRLNRAAEIATPKAKALFVQAVQDMTITDAKNILTGPNNAATQYLRQSMGGQLSKDIAPIIEQTLASAGAVQAYDQVMGRYAQIPFMPDAKANLQNYVTQKALDGIFYYVAQEEAAIRANPAKRTTDLLKKVFSAAQ